MLSMLSMLHRPGYLEADSFTSNSTPHLLLSFFLCPFPSLLNPRLFIRYRFIYLLVLSPIHRCFSAGACLLLDTTTSNDARPNRTTPRPRPRVYLSGPHVTTSELLVMTPAVGSRAAGSPDDAASIALQGASLAFQKRTPPSQHQPEHSRENGALLAATSSVERAKSPGSTTAAARSSPRRSHPGQRVAADASPPEIESVLAAGLVVARLQQLGASSTAGTASQTTAPTPMVTTAPRAHSTSPSPHLALRLASPQLPATVAAAKNPSLIAATLAASRGGSPTVTALRKPRRMQSVNALQDLDAVDSQPIPPTTSLISMFEVDEAAGQDTPRLRQVPTSLTEPSVVRKTTRPSPIPIKQITVESAPPTSKSNPKQRTGKGQSYERPPTPPKAVGKKSAACAPRRPPTPPAVTEAAPAPAPITPTSASKAIFRAAASKPRLTPPKVRATRKADGPSNPVTPSKVTSQTLSTTAMKNLDATGEVTPRRKRVRKPSPLGLSKPSKDGRIPDIAPPKQDSPTTPRHKSPTPRVISRSTPEVLSPKPTRVTRTASLHSGTPPPAIILRPMYDVQSPPSPDPQKRTNAEKRPPTPPKPRSSQRLAPARLASGRPRGSSDTPLTKATPVHSMWGLPIVSSTTPDTPRISKTEPWPPNRRESIVNAPPSPTHEPRGSARLSPPIRCNSTP
ncbi:EPS15 domain-containing [Cordyceps militaris]|uniref:EPS15 domain-containing n=1 Tax=Cordyceps militaris TaxID=73501 RepID=A0A2H4SMU0_CORMI|nr:EPS15 domain-containing [Cordyceps militaris]